MATVSKAKLCNMALSLIGASSIETLAELSTEAQECDLWFDEAFEQTLEAFDWSFARKRQTLALHSEAAPTDQWEFRYQYPSDCVKMRFLENPLGKRLENVPMEIETDTVGDTQSILTDLEDAVGVFTRIDPVVTLAPPLFRKAFACLLGSYIAYALTKKRTLEERMMTRWSGWIQVAQSANANEHQEEPERDAVWHRRRDGDANLVSGQEFEAFADADNNN